jgi:hypothetical protein
MAMSSSLRLSIAIAAVLVVGLAPFASAQTKPKGRQGSPMYDVKSETTITGTIESIETITGPGGRGRRGLGGTHLVVKTKTDTLEVHVGPTAYLSEQKITVAKGDTVEILGSRVTIDDEPVLLARQITKGTDKWTLRDASGRPLWSGPRR